MPHEIPTASFDVRWTEIDINWHMRNTAYSEFGTQMRLQYLAERGFPVDRFANEGFGPVIFREETRYYKEFRLGDFATYDYRLAGVSPDGSHFELHHNVTNAKGELAAILRVEGAWLSIASRKLCRPPDDLRELMEALPHTDDFRELKSVAK